MRRSLLSLCLLIFLSSCYSYKVFPAEYQHFDYTGEKKKAFIVNPELKKEYSIFEQAGIFSITTDSSDNSAVKIRLHGMRRKAACGQPIIASAITLGQIPVYFPDRYEYNFEEINETGTINHNFELQIAQRVWFWDLFKFKKNFNGNAGKALFGSYYKPLSLATATTAKHD